MVLAGLQAPGRRHGRGRDRCCGHRAHHGMGGRRAGSRLRWWPRHRVPERCCQSRAAARPAGRWQRPPGRRRAPLWDLVLARCRSWRSGWEGNKTLDHASLAPTGVKQPLQPPTLPGDGCTIAARRERHRRCHPSSRPDSFEEKTWLRNRKSSARNAGGHRTETATTPGVALWRTVRASAGPAPAPQLPP